ncbi:MAG: diguanylate cyclase [Acholeplasmataceae bacterium]|nr:diguanylate cyclase [Acholeplasmataceae bacterium]
MKKPILIISIAVVLTILSYLLTLLNYNLFHLLVEVSMLLIGVLIYFTSHVAQRLNRNKLVKVFSVFVLFSAVVIFLHSLAYEGLDLMTGYGPNLSLQLWIVANFVLAIGFIVGLQIFDKETTIYKSLFIIIGLATFSIVLIYLRVFPDAYIIGQGHTAFKIASEIITVLLYLVSIYLLYLKKDNFEKSIYHRWIAAFILLIIGQSLFIGYEDFFGLLNFFGHMFRLFAFIEIIAITRLMSVVEPIDMLIEDANLQKAIVDSEDRLNRSQAIAQSGSWELDIQTKKIWASTEAFKIYELKQTSNYIDYKEVHKMVADEDEEMMNEALINLIQKNEKYDVTFTLNTPSKKKRIHSKAQLSYNEKGQPHKVLGVIKDITELQEYENLLIYQGNHDYLTGLHNRRSFIEEFNKLDHKANYPLGVMMIDVNGLKIINDAYGHAIGDLALQKIASILTKSFRPQDIIARFGGDEFGVIIPNITFDELQEIKEVIKLNLKKNPTQNIILSVATGFEIKNKYSEENLDELLKLAENHMYRHKIAEGTSVRSQTINAILKTLTSKYDTERIHSERVSKLCKKIGVALGIKSEDLKELELAGMYHDIGKISIPDEILNKPGKLTHEEFEIIKTHPEISYQILRAADEYSDLAIHSLYHHERWDGKGYPSGKKGKDIPLFSRIICIADSYEAMTAKRPYKEKMSHDDAIKEIVRCSGTQFDPEIAKVFIKIAKPSKS